MKDLLYLHGFASSPQSLKAQQTLNWYAEHHPEVTVHAPQLAISPEQAWQQIQQLVESTQPSGVLGSSLGGFYANAVHRYLKIPAVMINPAVTPANALRDHIGTNKFWHTDRYFEFSQADVDFLEGLTSDEIGAPQSLWLMVQTHDATLDFKQATERYASAKCSIEYGGDHSFVDYPRYLPAIHRFLSRFM
ncbi:YqiA/YcfP family alpha/beta fold hydrolase [uncultured Umboniibacter sp.]|uniref:YqiA/YcfP family alpha/beta fold hydrolase n=1 Tax=uncultured Umboniibacter sp. TaxID=1798917 RepID=UPI00260673EA|nr:YqiA/YcfP family alpha/beta fold hydrolase [uncultured Umboniibacter sp.]